MWHDASTPAFWRTQIVSRLCRDSSPAPQDTGAALGMVLLAIQRLTMLDAAGLLPRQARSDRYHRVP